MNIRLCLSSFLHFTRPLSSVLRPLSFTILISLTPLLSHADYTEGDYTYTVANGQATITDFNSSFSGALSITSFLGGCPVTSIGDYAFEECTGLTSVTIPGSVKNIRLRAFAWCTGLNDVVIPNSVTTFGASAFESCHGLTSVTIPNSVTSIGDYAFYDCIGLNTLSIGSGVTSIGASAFEYCASLTSVAIPNNVSSIGDSAFYECIGLNTLSFGSGVISIGVSAFECCTSLTSVTIPNNVSSIGDSAFGYCEGLNTVTIGSGVTSIGAYAFQCCGGLISITIPNNVRSIGDSAFDNCAGLNTVFIGSGVTSIGNSAFYICTGLTNITVDAGNPAYASSGDVLFSKDFTILIQYPGGKTGAYAIPPGVTAIGDYAFGGCIGLTGVSIPDSVTNIGDCAFYDCSGLTSVTIPDNVTSIGTGIFGSCTILTNITVAASNRAYASADGVLFDKNFTVLIQCPGGKTGSYAIPGSATNIGSSSFMRCTNLTSVIIPDSVTAIGYDAFFHCTSLTNVTVGCGVTSIGDRAFAWCLDLTSVYFDGNAPTGDNYYLFAGTSATVYYLIGTTGWEPTFGGRPTVLLPYAFTLVDDTVTITAYFGTNSEATIPAFIKGKPVTAIASKAFHNCTGLIRVSIPDSVTTIGDSAFENCTGLTWITIPDGTTSIGDSTFENCTGLTSITIPKTVTSIGDSAFSGCTNLTSVLFQSNPPETLGTNVFSSSTGTIYYLPAFAANWPSTFGERPTVLSGVSYTVSANQATITRFNSPYSGPLTIPIALGGYPVVAIRFNAFSNCTGLTSVIIPARVTSIGNGAFSNCTGLTNLLFRGNVPTIVGSAILSSTPATVYYLPGTTGWGPIFAAHPTVCWNPAVQRDAGFGFASGRFAFNIAGTTNIPVKVEACTNLSTHVWSPVTNASLGVSGKIYVTDPASAALPARFYRIVFP